MSQTKFKPVAEQLEYLKKGVAEIIREDEFVSKLRRSHDTGKPLRAKLGVDPTAPSIHIGHMLPFMVLAWCYVYGIKAVWLVRNPFLFLPIYNLSFAPPKSFLFSPVSPSLVSPRILNSQVIEG